MTRYKTPRFFYLICFRDRKIPCVSDPSFPVVRFVVLFSFIISNSIPYDIYLLKYFRLSFSHKLSNIYTPHSYVYTTFLYYSPF